MTCAGVVRPGCAASGGCFRGVTIGPGPAARIGSPWPGLAAASPALGDSAIPGRTIFAEHAGHWTRLPACSSRYDRICLHSHRIFGMFDPPQTSDPRLPRIARSETLGHFGDNLSMRLSGSLPHVQPDRKYRAVSISRRRKSTLLGTSRDPPAPTWRNTLRHRALRHASLPGSASPTHPGILAFARRSCPNRAPRSRGPAPRLRRSLPAGTGVHNMNTPIRRLGPGAFAGAMFIL
jgi:hypothetical protein